MGGPRRLGIKETFVELHQSCLSLVRISLAEELEAVKLRRVAGIAKSCGIGGEFFLGLEVRRALAGVH